jgi:Glutaredoxin and related proteins
MTVIRIYTTDACPKCRALKTLLKDLGATFDVRDMAKHMPYLQANDGWPRDNSAPLLEIAQPGKDPVFYDHYSLFDRNGIKKDFIELVVDRCGTRGVQVRGDTNGE